MHHEDALKFMVAQLSADPKCFVGDQPEETDVLIPRAVSLFLVQENAGNRAFYNPEHCQRAEFNDVWIAFYDAAAELCRRGVLRLGDKCAKARGGPRYATFWDGYSITVAGSEWLKNSTTRNVPTAPGRYLECLENPGKVLGAGFLQRAGEAAGCRAYENHLACCAMCGAAAESALLAIATAKTDDPAGVQREYNKHNGRRNVTKLIFGLSPTSPLSNQFESAFSLLSYWRDEAAHGGPSTITQVHAYDALDRLLRLAFFAWDNWQELTGKSRP